MASGTRYLRHTPSYIPRSTETTVLRGMLQLFQISQMVLQLGMIGYDCNPNTQEVATGRDILGYWPASLTIGEFSSVRDPVLRTQEEETHHHL